jgi:DNA-binding MarR family transcriptional regulator
MLGSLRAEAVDVDAQRADNHALNQMMTASQIGGVMDDDVSRWPTGRLLSAAARRVEREWNLRLEEWQLTHSSFPVLVFLAESDRSQRELAAAMGVTEQTTSRMLARLERAGYVARRLHPGDRRRHVVTLLPAGAEALARASDPRTIEEVATRGLGPDQVAALREALVAMVVADPHPSAGKTDERPVPGASSRDGRPRRAGAPS